MKRRIGNLTLRCDDESDTVTVFDSRGLFVGQITEEQILKLASKQEKTSIRIDSNLRDELWDLVNGDDRSISDVVRSLKQEHDVRAGDYNET